LQSLRRLLCRKSERREVVIFITAFNPNTGENHEEWIEVNIAVNTPSEMEQKREYWKKFYNANQVHIKFKLLEK
jgi:hypothetical protein